MTVFWCIAMSVIAMAQTHVAGKYHAKNQKIMFRNKVNLPLKQANTIIYLFIYVLCIHTQNIHIRLIFYYCHMIVMAQTMSKKETEEHFQKCIDLCCTWTQVSTGFGVVTWHFLPCLPLWRLKPCSHAKQETEQHIQKWFSRIKKIMLHFDKIQFFDELPCL